LGELGGDLPPKLTPLPSSRGTKGDKRGIFKAMLRLTPPIIIILGIVSLFAVSIASAAGVGISPGRLEFHDSSKGLKATLHVINTGETKSDYEVYAEGEYKDWFNILPNQFSLFPNEELAVEISLSKSAATLGEHHTTISVVAFADSEDATIGSGLKVPVDISLTSATSRSESVGATADGSSAGSVAESESETGEPLTSGEPGVSTSRMPLWIALAISGVVTVGTIVGILVVRRRKGVGHA